MNTKLLFGLVIALPLFTVACGKTEAPVQPQTGTEAPAQSTADVQVSAEQQAAIDSVDKPNPEAIKVEGENAAPTAEVAIEETPAVQTEQATQ